MFENFRVYKQHLDILKFGIKDAEKRYTNDEYTLKQFIEILENHIRVGSAPIINQKKLRRKYIKDFCKRNNIDSYGMINQIRNMESPNLPHFDGNWYFTKTKK